MSLHRSLVGGRRGGQHRNVLSREERVAKLAEEGRWNAAGSSIFGLPKVRSIKAVAGKKAKKKEAAAAEAVVGAEGAPEAATGGEAPAGAASAKAAPAKGAPAKDARAKGGK